MPLDKILFIVALGNAMMFFPAASFAVRRTNNNDRGMRRVERNSRSHRTTVAHRDVLSPSFMTKTSRDGKREDGGGSERKRRRQRGEDGDEISTPSSSDPTDSLDGISDASEHSFGETNDGRIDPSNASDPETGLPPTAADADGIDVSPSRPAPSGRSGAKEWDVYVCQSKQCKERGSGATLGAFMSLAPSDLIRVHPAIFSKSKGNGPNIRCVQRGDDGIAFEVNNVDSVDKVYRTLTTHMGVQNVNTTARECLKWYYRGNSLLQAGDINAAIESYDKAIDTRYRKKEGLILVMRATAYLERALRHRKILKEVAADLSKYVLPSRDLDGLLKMARDHPSLGKSARSKMTGDAKMQGAIFQKLKYRHGLCEFALLHATQDSLRATELLPEYAGTWLRAGDSLSELKKFTESKQYYEKALELDPLLKDTLVPMMEQLENTQRSLKRARDSGWPEDILKVALDVDG